MPDTNAPLVFKAGTQSVSDPWTFVMSSPTKDSYGDVVVQDWKLQQFKRNPIALWMHSSSTPIGVWEDVKVEGGKLVGRLKLAARGTSALIDTLWALVEQRILRAVSVGFRPGKAEPLDEKDPFGGYRLAENELFECSLVSVPANPDALSLAYRAFPPGAAADLRHTLFAKPGEHPPCEEGACVQLLRASGKSPDPSVQPIHRRTSMTLAERIKALQAEVVRTQDELTSQTAEENPDLTVIGELTDQLTRARTDLEQFQKAEQAMAGESAPKAPAAGSDPAPRKPAGRIETRLIRPKGHRAFATVASILKAQITRGSPIDVAREYFRDDQEIELLVRAAVAPAVSGTAAWAGNLLRESWGEFVELLRDVSIYPRIPGARIDLTETTNFPVQAGRGNLAGGFIAENGVIPVKAGSIGTTSLAPKKLAVISAYSKELARRSMPSIMAVIEQQILADTAEVLDTTFLANGARSATQPAGLQDTTETGASNINAVTNAATGAHGSTVAEILKDVDALLGRVEAIKVGEGAWVMNPAQIRGLRNKQDGTTGHFVFRDSIDAGRFEGFPILSSTNVTGGVVAFIGGSAMVFGSEFAPSFEMSDSATLHFENASPLAIGTVATPTTVAAPAYSLFQQDLLAIKMTMGLDWRIVRQAGVQVLTGATGW